MITKYDQQYEEACEALEKAEQVRNEAQWEVVKCQRKVAWAKILMRQEIAEQIRQAKQSEEVSVILNRGDAARDAQKERIAKHQQLASQIRQAANLPEKETRLFGSDRQPIRSQTKAQENAEAVGKANGIGRWG